MGHDIDYLERAFDAAKYGDYSPHPYMDITIPSIVDPSLAPDRRTRDVDSCSVCALQVEERRLEFAATRVRRHGSKRVVRLRAELESN